MPRKSRPFVFYANGEPVRPGDRVEFRGRTYQVLSLWIDRDTDTNVSLYTPGARNAPRVNSRDITRQGEE